ncbi:MAG: amidohydrolase family protein [Acidimicrobiales bacterium]
MLGADHHVHLFSPAVIERVRPVTEEFTPGSADELVRLLDDDGVGRALVLSVAYLFGMPDLGEPGPTDIASENDWVAEQVGRHPERLAACCSVNPLLPGAIGEIERCAATGSFVGLKLHLANSKVDLRDTAHLQALAEVFGCADATGLVVAIHMRTRRPDYGTPDAEALIEHVLPSAPGVAVQIAHAAGWGGYDVPTDAALAAFATWAAGHPAAAARVFFDLALAPLDYGVEEPVDPDPGEPAAPAGPGSRFDRLVERVRAFGLDHVLFGTDWPVVSPARYLAELEARVPLRPDEFEALRRHVAPWLQL